MGIREDFTDDVRADKRRLEKGAETKLRRNQCSDGVKGWCRCCSPKLKQDYMLALQMQLRLVFPRLIYSNQTVS